MSSKHFARWNASDHSSTTKVMGEGVQGPLSNVNPVKIPTNSGTPLKGVGGKK